MSAARLCSMGIDPEAVRDRLRQSAEQGAPCNCGEMRQAVQDFKELGQYRIIRQEQILRTFGF